MNHFSFFCNPKICTSFVPSNAAVLRMMDLTGTDLCNKKPSLKVFHAIMMCDGAIFLMSIHSYSTATYEGINYTVAGGGGAGLHKHYGEMGSFNLDIWENTVDIDFLQLISYIYVR